MSAETKIDPDETYLDYEQLKARGIVRWSRKHLGTMIAEGKFPAPTALGENTRAWPWTAIKAWLASRPLAVPHRAAGRTADQHAV